MTEQEKRINHNKQALAIAAATRKKKYSGIIDVELEPSCLTGAAILAVSEDIYNSLPKDARYTPHISDVLDKNDRPVREDKPSFISSHTTADLNALL